MLLDASEPSCYHETISSHNHVKWKQAMQKELDSIHKNVQQSWDLVPLTESRKALPCKWVVCNYKYTFDSALPKYKARVVANGFNN